MPLLSLKPRATSPKPFFLQLVLAILGAAALYTGITLPAKSVGLTVEPSAVPIAYGGYHLHSNRSDGTGTPDEIAAAAARAGLQFIILTDHGDATRVPDAPQYRHGVLCIDAVEIGTAAGHIVGLGLEGAAPYPLAGEARDVIEDIHRLGGWTVVAHPDSPKSELRWRAWNVPYEGVEWLNADSEWRDETAARLTAAFARYMLRPAETVASLFERPTRTLLRWDAATQTRPVVGLAALDTHGGLAWVHSDEPRSSRVRIGIPSYEKMFRTLAQAAILDQPLTGQAAADGAALLRALRAGRTFSVVTAIAAPGALTFTAERNGVIAGMGQTLPDADGPVRIRAIASGVPAARIVLLRNGSTFQTSAGSLDVTAPLAHGAYRVEVYYPGRDLPWIVSNPIYVGEASTLPPSLPTPPPVRLVELPGADSWNVERDAASTGVTILDGRNVSFRFSLGPGAPAGQFAAVVTSLDEPLRQLGFDRVAFIVRASRPMRISVQLRLPGGPVGQRWRHSVYADATPRAVVLDLQDFLPVESTSQRPIVAHVKTVLFVVDTVNSSPGTIGTVWLSEVTLGVGKTDR